MNLKLYLLLFKFSLLGIHCHTQVIEGNTVKGIDQNPVQKNSKEISLTNSVLAKGDWYRFYVDTTGIFRITPQFLEQLGMNLTEVNPAKIKIYGNGGKMLPLINKKNHEFGLKENQIEVIGGEDGILSGEDYILLYAEGTQGYNEDSNTHVNVYEDKSFYFITADGAKGNRVSSYREPGKKADTLITSFREYQFYESDKINLGYMGRRWFGNPLSKDNIERYPFYFPNRMEKTPVHISVVAACKSNTPSNLQVSLNTKLIGTIPFSKTFKNSSGRNGQLKKVIRIKSDSLTVKLQCSKEEPSLGNTYLDYISVEAERHLIVTDKQMMFTIPKTDTSKVARVTIENAKKIKTLWHINHSGNINRIKGNVKNDTLMYKTTLDHMNKFIVVPEKTYLAPKFILPAKVENQNLKGTILKDENGNFSDLAYLIIAPKILVPAARQLASYRERKNNIRCEVVSIEQIYNEFSSGKQDIVAIRNFIRYVYENASSNEKRLKYVCLFGDSSVDYKNYLAANSISEEKEKNYIPSFESYQSLYHLNSFVSDDFFVCLDPDEGLLTTKDKLDVVVGRILVNTPKSALSVVSKIIEHDSSKSPGIWKSNLLFVSDDVDRVWEKMIQENSNQMADTLLLKFPFYNTRKLFSDTFLQKNTKSSQSYPQASRSITDKIEKGVGIINYFGHGSQNGLATEFLLSKKDAMDLTNTNRYPLFITVTCLATRFDHPFYSSFGEKFFQNPVGGAVAMIATTREISSTSGARINKKLLDCLFSEEGIVIKPAKALLKTKNETSSNQKRHLFYIGDPMMDLQFPTPGVELSAINNIPTEKFKDTLKALDKIRLSGFISDAFGKRIKNYNGQLVVRLLDKETQRTTLANDRIKAGDKLIRLQFKEQGPVIARSNTEVVKGKFMVEFVIPKDVIMSTGKRKLLFYSYKENGYEDYVGVYENLYIGGMRTKLLDKKGPDINLSLDGKKAPMIFSQNKTPFLEIALNDEQGINLATGIGHQIKVILDQNYNQPILLNGYFINDSNTYKRGSVHYKLPKLKEGFHTLTVNVWDTHNNNSSKTLNFVIIENLKPIVR